MATISKLQGAQASRLAGQVADTTRSLPDNQTPAEPKGVSQAMKEQRQYHETREELDPARIQQLVDKLQKSLDRASADPHEVGFRQDPRTEAFVIEIKNPEGQVIKQFPPEKVLNLQHKMDELSGMVIDRMT